MGVRLKDKVCLVTGSSRGIGKAIALTFAREGANVVVNYEKSRERAEQVVDEISKMSRRAIAVKADVSNKVEVDTMVNKALHEFGKIDVLVNNAGIAIMSPSILEATREDWERTLAVNLLGPYYCIQAVAPYMIKQRYGKIINISSNAALGTIGRTSGKAVAYTPAKAGLIILTKRLAFELGKYNINVNAIAPGITRTEIINIGRTPQEVEELLKEKARSTALGRVAEPQDMANVALFLASDESSFVTGQLIVVDGGRFDYLSHSQ
ncbi:MAG: glucose 1-dehydrogenase [Nitrososphaeria archaeon]